MNPAFRLAPPLVSSNRMERSVGDGATIHLIFGPGVVPASPTSAPSTPPPALLLKDGNPDVPSLFGAIGASAQYENSPMYAAFCEWLRRQIDGARGTFRAYEFPPPLDRYLSKKGL